MKVLVSGFGPFPGFDINPSQKLVEALAADPPAGVELDAVVLPVVYGEAPRLLLDRARRVRPAAVVCFGVATGSDEIRLERIAINCDESAVPDGQGERADGRRIVEGGPDGLFTRLPLAAMLRAMEGHVLPVRVSNTAGTYLCNHLMYHALADLPGVGLDVPRGFIHIPPASEWNAGGGPTWPFAHILTAAGRLLGALAHSL